MPLRKRHPSLHTRPPLTRMVHIHEQLKTDAKPNCTTLAEKLEVTPKTIMRDIEYMIDQLGLPIEYNRSEFCYHYTTPVQNLPLLQVSEGELFALLLASRVLDQYKGSSYEKDLRAIFNKLAGSLEKQVSFSEDAGLNSFSFSKFGQAIITPETYQTVSKAVLKRTELSFDYKKIYEKKPTQRRVLPYHLADRNGMTYLIGLDLGQDGIRQFALTRIQNAKMGSKKFLASPGFDPQKYLGQNFGAYRGTETFEVRVLFRGDRANLLLERHWHPTQKLQELGDDRVELTLQVNDLEEVANWLLSWGDVVESAEPRELLELLKEKTRRLCATYLGTRAGLP